MRVDLTPFTTVEAAPQLHYPACGIARASCLNYALGDFSRRSGLPRIGSIT